MKNEPAFPRDHAHDGHNGMTLRDYFAAAALQGLIAANPGLTATAEFLAADAYGIADAMLEERNK